MKHLHLGLSNEGVFLRADSEEEDQRDTEEREVEQREAHQIRRWQLHD